MSNEVFSYLMYQDAVNMDLARDNFEGPRLRGMKRPILSSFISPNDVSAIDATQSRPHILENSATHYLSS